MGALYVILSHNLIQIGPESRYLTIAMILQSRCTPESTGDFISIFLFEVGSCHAPKVELELAM